MPPLNPTSSTAGPARRYPALHVLLFFLVLAAIVFRAVWPADQMLFSTDDGIGVLAYAKARLPGAFQARWDDNLLVGHPQAVSPSWTTLLLWLLPLHFFVDWIHALDLLLGSFLLVLFLREKGRSWRAGILAGLIAFWLGSTFTLVYAGHLGKFGCVFFASLYLLLVERAVQRSSLPYAILAGGAMGGMLVEQPDLGLFFAIPLGLYAVYGLVQKHGRAWVRLVAPLLAIVLTASLILFRTVHALFTMYTTAEGAAVGGGEESNWQYCTQWSWPPLETIEFIAPGFMGWRSGEPEGPYWGRMGRSAGWEKTKQGFQNFKLETFYLSALTLLLAGLAVGIGCGRRSRAPPEWRGPIRFWSVVALVTYLLALGKFFPLYWFFYQLPGMSSIRNPVKFMQVTQLALAILAAYGFDAAFQPAARGEAADVFARRRRQVGWGALGLAGALGLWAVVLMSSPTASIGRFEQEGWGSAADLIVERMIAGLFHGAGISLLGGLALLWGAGSAGGNPRWTRGWSVAILVVVVAEILWLAPRYVKPLERAMVEENEVVRFLKQQLRGQRLALMSQAGFYNHWLTYLFPYHEIPVLNVTQLRMPEDYSAFLGKLGSNQVRLWQLCAVGFLMGPSQIWGQIQNAPELKDFFEIVYAFNVVPEGSSVRVIPATREQPGQHCIIRNKLPAARYLVSSAWDIVPDEVALERLASPQTPLFEKTLLSTDTAGSLAPADAAGILGEVQLRSYRPGRVHLQVSADRPSLLRLSDKYAPGWKAEVNQRPAELRRCDYLFQAVHLEPGLHQVIVKYAPGNATLWVQLAGVGLCAAALACVLLQHRKRD
jgi:hypothetical protein